MAADLPDVVERFVADVSAYVRDLERAAREADHFGEQQDEARERVRRFGHQAEEAAERAARAQAEAAREAERLAEGTGDMERAARAAARAQRELERAQMAQSRAARAAAQQVDNEAEQYRELARQAARAAAEQQLMRFRAAGQFREHNQLLRRLREAYGDFGDEFNRTFQLMESRSRRTASRVSDTLGKIPLKFQAGLLALPLLASVAGGAITLAVGGALSAVAIMAAAKNAEVKAEFSDLKDHVVDEVQSWAKPWESTLIDMAGFARSTFDALGPDLEQVFADLAPAVRDFVGDVADGLVSFGPMIRRFGDAFRAVLATLGPEMDDILGDLSAGLTDVAEAVEANPKAFGEFARNLATVVRAAASLIGILTRLEAVNRALPSGLSIWNTLGDQWDGLIAKAQGFSDRTLVMNGALRGVAMATDQANTAQSRSQVLMQLASQSAQQLKQSLDALSGKTLSAREAAANYAQTVLQVTETIKRNGKAHGLSTQKGIENEQMLTRLARQAQDTAVAMRDNGASAREVAKYMEGARRTFIKQAEAAGYSRSEAVKLADKLYGVKRAANSIPKRKHTEVTADTKEAKSTVERFKDWVGRQVARINISSIWPFAEGGPVPAFAVGGPVGIPGYPTGGPVRGPGTGTSDSILARLSNGEFVMTAKAAQMFGPMLAMMNRVAAGGSAPSMSTAAPAVAAVSRGGGGPVVHVTNVNVHVAGSVLSERELWEVVQRQGGRYNVFNPGTNPFARGGGAF
ncbi:hypothetical protein [Actinomadura geliboluensis]|uniref:hypothetical protein n=1 Tax=Actinomadura geliboluensis TaxID=882440 RepID=UPI00371506E6